MTDLALKQSSDLMEQIALAEAQGGTYNQVAFRMPVLTEEQEHELATEYHKSKNKQVKYALIMTHIRHVVTIARSYLGYGINENDLVQEGSLGLIKAVERFDPERKVRLSTYATHWIKSAIGEYVIKNWKIFKAASTSAQRKLFYRLRTISARLGRRLTNEDAKAVAEELSVRPQDVLEMESRMLLPEVPFESTATDNDDEYDNSPSARLVADEGMHAEVTVVENEVKSIQEQALVEALEQLNDRERRILDARAMSESGKDVKLHELAKELGISTERVRQLEKKAMAKVKKHVLATCERLID